ncbi:sigma-70 family RNA polymerase sigma factor [Actinoplanes sp. NEAU-A12]|uniref:Sigma-70 family RNA polymerase sigma factor n=1 Tax=Actinoplanes sandaracinus TaxID=3045177 RepID=A0ABT6WZJ4_9ACTN|nr:sigma-70 family RNA polymerase sigma factor [Actinoplanes sandaracinus]MDI6105144.1 sigma-70 family RNA polymerase sigma factor [Actinoplanes sandaracinus]
MWAQGKSPFCHNHKSRWYAVGSPDIEEFARRREAAGDDRFDFRPLQAKRQLKLEPQYALQCRHDERQVNTHSSAVSPVIRLAASGPVGSLEACQDVLMQVARNIAGFQGRSRFSTWLHVVIANGARQTYRGLKRRAAEQGYADMPVDTPDARTTSVIAGSRLDLLDALKRLEASRPELVAPMVLRDICQLDYKEIARHLAIPEGTVKSRIHQARGQVRAYLLAGS